MSWSNLASIPSHKYTCGHCSSLVASEKGYRLSGKNHILEGSIHICPHCNRPTYFAFSDKQVVRQIPSSSFGNPVEKLPDAVQKLYDEARICTSNSSYTATVMVCRTLLMHIAVEKGAKKKKSFKDYVNYLEEGNYLPTNSKEWVDHIREQGNEANHEIVLKDENDAKNLVECIEMLIRLIYEYPTRTSNFKTKNDQEKS